MNDRKIYEALARGRAVETVLPDLIQNFKAEAAVLYYVGREEAAVAFQSATALLLEEMKRKLIHEIQLKKSLSEEKIKQLKNVELSLVEEDLFRLEKNLSPTDIKVYLINFGNDIIGGLALAFQASLKNEPDEGQLEDLLVAFGFAQKIEAALRVNEEIKDRLERFSLVGRVFAEVLSIDRTLARLLEIALSLVGAGGGVFVVKSAPGETPMMPISWGMSPDWVYTLRLCDGRGFLETVLSEGKPLYLEDLSSLDSSSCPNFLKTMAILPLIYEGGTLGCLFVANPPRRFFEVETEHRTLAALASLAGGAIRSARHLEAELRAERLREEVRLAAHVQVNLLPHQLPQNDQMEIAAVLQPANDLGGDFYDVFELGEKKWGIMVADVSGKGASAAILMATARAYLHAFATEESAPSEVLQKMNAALSKDFRDGRFLTAIYLILDISIGQIRMAGAGHHPVFLLEANGEVQCIPCDDFPLGISTESKFTETKMTVKSGSTLLVYTDGLVEAAAPDGRFFGSGRMHAVITSLASIPAKQVIDRLLAEVKDWTGSHSFYDDLTVLVLKIK